MLRRVIGLTGLALFWGAVGIAWAQGTSPAPAPDPASTAVATLIGGFVVTGMTEIIVQFAANVGKAMPAWLKPILAGLIATGAVSVTNIHPFAGAGAWVPIANAVTVWALGAFIHDVAL